MSRLVLCSGCLRHVREDEASCPFCATGRAESGAAAAATGEPGGSRIASVSARAAILFFGAVVTAACGDKPTNSPDSNVVMPYGAPPNPNPDPTPDPQPSAAPTGPNPNVVMPYGVPPDPNPNPNTNPPQPSSQPNPNGSGSAKPAPTPVRIVPPYGVPPVPPPPPPPT